MSRSKECLYLVPIHIIRFGFDPAGGDEEYPPKPISTEQRHSRREIGNVSIIEANGNVILSHLRLMGQPANQSKVAFKLSAADAVLIGTGNIY